MTITESTPSVDGDCLVLAILRGGQQSTRIMHKSDAGLVQDCRWLDDPDGTSLVANFVGTAAANDEDIRPIGYGLIAVDFDRKSIISVQGYRDVSVFTADDFGHPRFVGPSWLDWRSVTHHAFEREAVDSVVYTVDGRRCARIPLAGPARRRQSLALRFASHAKPQGYVLRGFSFQPPGWTVRHMNGATTAPTFASERVYTSLTKSGWRCAPLSQWKQCHFG